MHPIAFKHPGTVMSPEMTFSLKDDTSKNNIRQQALQKLLKDTPLNYTPHALEVVDIGYNGNGNGHKAVTADGEMAYQAALAYWATHDIRYAKVGLRILKEWSQKNKEFKGDNAPLEAAWSVCSFARCAELLKHAKHAEVCVEWRGIERGFFAWLDKVIMPVLKNKDVWSWKLVGNWHYSIVCARMQIAILREDAGEFQWAVNAYKDNLNKTICYGGHPCHIAETLRDVTHSAFLIGGLLQLPEMAYHQGRKDVYDVRLHPMLEYHARIMLKEVPEGIKKEDIHTPYGYWNEPVWEIGLAHFNGRLKMPMPKTEANLSSFRPERVTFHWGAGTLTHYKRCG